MGSIRDILQKIKFFLLFPPSDILIALIIILVGFAGFGLGRLSALSTLKTPVTIENTLLEGDLSASPSQSLSSGVVVGSKNGSKYHFPWCSGAQSISKENLVSFASVEEAQRAGYTPAKNCKGLE